MSNFLDSIRFRNLLAVFFAASLAFLLSACVPSSQSLAQQQKANALSQSAASDQIAETIKRLQIAKVRDEANINNPNISAVRREDFMVQAAKADRAIKELQHGFPVSRGEIEEALLEVPSQHITPEYRAQLIQQLQKAQQLDEKREQEILIYWKDDQPAERSQFRMQAERAAKVAKDLQLGESVHWGEIEQALYVPPDAL
jgi:hypothetical protein